MLPRGNELAQRLSCEIAENLGSLDYTFRTDYYKLDSPCRVSGWADQLCARSAPMIFSTDHG